MAVNSRAKVRIKKGFLFVNDDRRKWETTIVFFFLYICHIPPKDSPISFVCMYFASTKYILHVKLESLLVEPFVLY